MPKFSKIARTYLLHVGNLDWTRINPDIFGSMIQAVADDEERGTLGMHCTSVPNNLERIYLGRRFKNDTERLEKLFELCTKMTGAPSGAPTPSSARRMKKPM